MNDFNKTNVKWGFKVLYLFVFAILTIAVCAGIWNARLGSWLSWCALALLVFVAQDVISRGAKLLQENPGGGNPKEEE